jgi:hypothetical protein
MSRNRVRLEKLEYIQLVKKFPAVYGRPLLNPQELTTKPYPMLVESTP